MLPIPLQIIRAMERLERTPRGELCKLAADLAETPWIVEAFMYAAEADIRVLGRFDLIGADGRTPWPSVIVEVLRRSRHEGQPERKGHVAVYVNPEGKWEGAERESGKAPWAQYRGDRAGTPNVMNGDNPAEAPEAQAAAC